MNSENSIQTENLKAILFDMDGVLVDSMTYHLKSWQELLGSFNITVSDQFIFEHEGAMAPQVISELFTKHGHLIDEEQITDIFLAQNSMFLTRYLSQVSLYPDSLTLLSQLKNKGILLGLVTSSRKNLIEKIWTKEELSYFSAIISSDDTERFKPYPDPYLKAIQKIQQEPMNCLVIENAPAGIQSAFSAGIPCFAISSTLPAEKLSGADRVFPDLKSLNSFLGEILP
jgi:beta-phosphoglucomutase